MSNTKHIRESIRKMQDELCGIEAQNAALAVTLGVRHDESLVDAARQLCARLERVENELNVLMRQRNEALQEASRLRLELGKSGSEGLLIDALVKESHDRAKRKGFYDPEPTVPEQLCLIHSEVSEALEAWRDDGMHTVVFASSGSKPVGLPSELADIVIRVCDMAGFLGIDLAAEIRRKSDYNETRPVRHGRANR